MKIAESAMSGSLRKRSGSLVCKYPLCGGARTRRHEADDTNNLPKVHPFEYHKIFVELLHMRPFGLAPKLSRCPRDDKKEESGR